MGGQNPIVWCVSVTAVTRQFESYRLFVPQDFCRDRDPNPAHEVIRAHKKAEAVNWVFLRRGRSEPHRVVCQRDRRDTAVRVISFVCPAGLLS